MPAFAFGLMRRWGRAIFHFQWHFPNREKNITSASNRNLWLGKFSIIRHGLHVAKIWVTALTFIPNQSAHLFLVVWFLIYAVNFKLSGTRVSKCRIPTALLKQIETLQVLAECARFVLPVDSGGTETPVTAQLSNLEQSTRLLCANDAANKSPGGCMAI